MNPPRIKRAHGGVRGADLSRGSLLFDGPFGRMFRTLPAADFGADEAANNSNFAALASQMNGDFAAKDGPDAEESGIPAAYTYLGQFIDHDLTFDPASSLQKQNDPDALEDYRTPKFDLDNVYGRGPDDQPYMYCTGTGVNAAQLVRGTALTGAATNPNATDLPRAANGRAIIGDPRNDENKIVSQMQGLFHRFHNRVAKDNPTWQFQRVQQEVRFHYQWVVLHDFLERIVSKKVLEKVVRFDGHRTNITTEFFHARDLAYMPLEFSAACYRFGHSMVRPGYRLNDGDDALLPIFAAGPSMAGGKATDLRGFEPPQSDLAIDWNRFADLSPLAYGTLVDNPDPTLPANRNRLQLAYKIDTSLVGGLSTLPDSVASNPNILALRNLQRGWRMRLPSGQDVARAMGVIPLTDDEIKIGKFTGDPTDLKGSNADFGDGSFANNCPLWIYTLAETRHHVEKVKVVTTEGDKFIDTPKLGAVGGRIVAETIAGLIQYDSYSFVSLDPLWTPTRDVGAGKPRSVSYAASDGSFRLKDLIAAALGDGTATAC
ncbi:peroxidase family protein [Terriglobus aquaticus]|uniref:Peroxidase family protein n=1 Tax=Terriglobus aquaticus TaxID=940139 RepID=A0ABW9KJE6_9BACT|nr:heme peroxidase family protein [Terriglobus aquaticus]